MKNNLLREDEIIQGVVSGSIATKNYDFKDVELKKKVLSDYLECSVDEVKYDKGRNRFLFNDEQYHILYEDELAIQKIININDNIKFGTFFMKPHEIGDVLNMNIEDVEKKYNIKDTAYDVVTITEVFSHSNNSIDEFIYKINKYYPDYYFLSYDGEEIISDGLYIYLYGV